MPRPAVTAVIPCKNERDSIAKCIASVRCAVNEIVVADSGSTDGTLDIVRAMPDVRVIERAYVNPADFKNWAMTHCHTPWVLAIDADEQLTAPGANSLRQTLEHGPSKDGYYIRRRNLLFGREVRFTSWRRDKILALYRREVCRYLPGRVHEHLAVETGKIGWLRGAYMHDSIRSFAMYQEKTDRYTSWWAEEKMADGKGRPLLGMTVQPAMKFFNEYLFRGGFLDGAPGLIVSAMAAHYVFLKNAKLWQMRATANVVKDTELELNTFTLEGNTARPNALLTGRSPVHST